MYIFRGFSLLLYMLYKNLFKNISIIIFLLRSLRKLLLKSMCMRVYVNFCFCFFWELFQIQTELDKIVIAVNYECPHHI